MAESWFSGRFRVGDTAAMTRAFSAEDVAAFAAITGDDNPVHLDEAHAATTRFGRRIVHGVLTAGLISAVLGTRLPGPGCYYLGQTLRFKGPVFIDAPVKAEVEIIAIREDKPIVTLRTSCTTEAGVVIEGEAVMMILLDPAA
jgi:acyl dehydratase